MIGVEGRFEIDQTCACRPPHLSLRDILSPRRGPRAASSELTCASLFHPGSPPELGSFDSFCVFICLIIRRKQLSNICFSFRRIVSFGAETATRFVAILYAERAFCPWASHTYGQCENQQRVGRDFARHTVWTGVLRGVALRVENPTLKRGPPGGISTYKTMGTTPLLVRAQNP
jgi:hypothetical protein